MQGLILGAFGLIFGDGAGFHHRIEHKVAPFDCPLGMTEGIEVVRALNNAGQHRALRKVKLAHILAKVGLRSLAEAVNRKTAALAEVDLVRIRFENLFLDEAILEVKRHHNLRDLVLDGAPVSATNSSFASCMVNVEAPPRCLRSPTMSCHAQPIMLE